MHLKQLRISSRRAQHMPPIASRNCQTRVMRQCFLHKLLSMAEGGITQVNAQGLRFALKNTKANKCRYKGSPARVGLGKLTLRIKIMPTRYAESHTRQNILTRNALKFQRSRFDVRGSSLRMHLESDRHGSKICFTL